MIMAHKSSGEGRKALVPAISVEYLAFAAFKDVRTFEFQLAPLPRPGSIVLKPGQHVRLALPALQGKEASAPERTWTVTSSPQWFADHGRFQISVKLKQGGLASTWLHKLTRKALLWKLHSTSGIKLNDVCSDQEMETARLHFLGFAGEFGPQLDPRSGDLRKTMPRHIIFLTARAPSCAGRFTVLGLGMRVVVHL